MTVTAPQAIDLREQMLRDFIAEQLAFAETHIACGRSFIDIGDDSGLQYCLDAAKAHMRAALESGAELRRQKVAAAA